MRPTLTACPGRSTITPRNCGAFVTRSTRNHEPVSSRRPEDSGIRTRGTAPGIPGWIKLNTNENPWPSSPSVVEAIQEATSGRLNIYPDPLATRFRQVAANLFDVEPDWILPANGSDENLTILIRAFVDPGERIAFPYPSYILYETLADLQGATSARLPLNHDWTWSWPHVEPIVESAKLVFVPNPNSPSGNRWSDDDILRLVPPNGVLVLDEAYGDFCNEPHRAEILQSELGRRIVITRTLSKSHSLAGIRMGFAIAHPELIDGMRKVKDSYNCNTLSLAAGAAALEDQDWMEQNRTRILSTRSNLTEALRGLGFDVVDSQANFVWTTHPKLEHEHIYSELKSQRILVRYMKFPECGPDRNAAVDGIRITIGTDEEIDAFLRELTSIVQ